MTDLLLANPGTGWDLVIRSGDLVLTRAESRAAEVAQRVVYRLSTWLGESPYDRLAGVPYIETVFGFEPVPGVVAFLTQIVLDTEGVDELLDDPVFLLDGRTLSITFTIRVSGQDVPIALQVAA